MRKYLSVTRQVYSVIGFIAGMSFALIDGYAKFIVYPILLVLYIVAAFVIGNIFEA